MSLIKQRALEEIETSSLPRSLYLKSQNLCNDLIFSNARKQRQVQDLANTLIHLQRQRKPRSTRNSISCSDFNNPSKLNEEIQSIAVLIQRERKGTQELSRMKDQLQTGLAVAQGRLLKIQKEFEAIAQQTTHAQRGKMRASLDLTATYAQLMEQEKQITRLTERRHSNLARKQKEQHLILRGIEESAQNLASALTYEQTEQTRAVQSVKLLKHLNQQHQTSLEIQTLNKLALRQEASSLEQLKV